MLWFQLHLTLHLTLRRYTLTAPTPPPTPNFRMLHLRTLISTLHSASSPTSHSACAHTRVDAAQVAPPSSPPTRSTPGTLAIDPPHLVVGAGARWREVYAELLRQNITLLPVGGGCPEVGVGGFVLGGGWSFLSRSYGLAADNLLDVSMVCANGSVVRASPSQHADLFWALRGGGGGNFGVVTQLRLQLRQPLSGDGLALVGELCWPPFAHPVLSLWEWWLAEYPRMPAYLDLDPVWLPLGVNGTRRFCFTVVCNQAQALCAPLVQRLVRRFPPSLNSVHRQPFLAWQAGNVNVTDAQQGALYLTSGTLLPGALTLPLLRELMFRLEESPSPRNLVLFHVGGGAIARLSPNATAFPHRNLQAVIQVKAIWDHPS
jgi:FAD binding domain